MNMRNLKFILIALVGVALCSCNLFNKNTPEYKLADLQGLWQENNTEHFVRFSTEKSDENPYLLGREWDEAEDVSESDLLDQRAQDGFPGNGWFKYWLEKEGELTEIHLMNNGGAEIPKVYVVTKLTDTDLEYYEKNRKSSKFFFSKVVQTKQ